MKLPIFERHYHPIHLNAEPEDFQGNNGVGRYVILPGSDGRAEQIASYFTHVEKKSHPRGHHLYLGELDCPGVPNEKIAVASISTGMGCPSTDIIVNELHKLGARRFWRSGTAGSLQPEQIKVGDVVIATASVRDEAASRTYVPAEFPATASRQAINAAERAAELHPDVACYFGIVHCKASLHGRQLAESPMAEENIRYMNIMRESGVLASEMETSQLFILSTLHNHALGGHDKVHQVIAGASLGILSDSHQFATKKIDIDRTINNSITIALESIKQLAKSEIGVTDGN